MAVTAKSISSKENNKDETVSKKSQGMKSAAIIEPLRQTHNSSRNDELAMMENRYQKLKNQFVELRDLRLTEPERIYQAYKTAVETRDKVQEASIKELKSQLDDVNAEVLALRTAVDKASASSTSRISEEELAKSLKAAEKEAREMRDLARRTERELATEIEHSKNLMAKLQSNVAAHPHAFTVSGTVKSGDLQDLSEKLHLYEDFTGMLITQTHVDMNAIKYNCVQSGKHGSLQFQITIPLESPDQIIYTPLLEQERDAKLTSVLSEALREEITFSRSEQGANFFVSLANAMSDDPSDSEDEE